MRDHGLMLLASGLLRAREESGLRTLRLRANQIELSEPECIAAVGELLSGPECTLAVIDLGSNQLGDRGALCLTEMLQENSSLTRLDVSSNGISSRGLCGLGGALADHRMLLEANAWGNRFDSAACAAWLPAMERLVLDFSVQEIDNVFTCVRV